MTSKHDRANPPPGEQLGFGFDQIEEEKATAHLPAEIDPGVAHYRGMLEQHNAAMLEGDEKRAMEIRKEANKVAYKLNGNEPGILGGPDASGYRLMDGTAAAPGAVPMWGQKGEFDIKVGEMPVHIKMDGMLGICSSLDVWPNFSASAVDPDKPFFSETGYRSFMGAKMNLMPGITPDVFAREVIGHFVKADCKGKLRQVQEQYRERYRREQDSPPGDISR